MYLLRTLLLLLVLACMWPAGAQVQVGQKHTLESSILREHRTYRVFLPASYAWEKDRAYPVLYVLDGETHFAHTAIAADYLATHGDIPEMIVVGIDSTVRVRDFTQTDWPKAWAGGGGADNFKRFLATELIPSVEKNHRTDGFRALSGHSAGGQFVLHCLATEPALFRAYMALSPSLDWDNNLPQRSLEKAFSSASKLETFLYVARSDDTGRALADYERLVLTFRKKSPKGFRWFSQAYPNETHVGVPLLAQIDALRRLYAGYRFHDDMMSRGLTYAEEHFRKVSATVGWTLPLPEVVLNEFAYEALAQDRTQAAIALFKRNVQAHPYSAHAWGGLADGYAKASQWREGMETAQRAIELAREFGRPNLAYLTAQREKMSYQFQQLPAPAN